MHRRCQAARTTPHDERKRVFAGIMRSALNALNRRVIGKSELPAWWLLWGRYWAAASLFQSVMPPGTPSGYGSVIRGTS